MNYFNNYQTDYCTCPVIWHGIYPPPPCPLCEQQAIRLAPLPYVPMPIEPEPLSDEEIDRIARKVAELLKDYL